MTESETYPTNEDVYERLVAYLDGELDADDSRQVEKRLAKDEAYRRELQKLQQTWDMLDELPPVEISETFTHTTVEMVAVSAASELDDVRDRQQRRHWLVWSLASALLLITSLASYVVATKILLRPNEKLVSDFPVIDDVELYLVADSVDFLRLLDEQGLFDEEVDDDL